MLSLTKLRERLLSGTAMAFENEADNDEEFEEACALFEAFHGYPPDETDDSTDIIEFDDGRILLYQLG